MPAAFARLGVQFEYPENWILEDEASGTGRACVSVVSPQGAFWSLNVHPAAEDLAGLMRTVLGVLREEYRDLDAEAAAQVIHGQQLVGFDIHFYCLDLTNTAQVRGFQTSQATYLLLSQAEDRDFEQLERVFLAMTTSLVRHVASTT